MYKKIEGQMNFEIESAYIYLAMASYLKHEGYDGMSASISSSVRASVTAKVTMSSPA